MTRIDEVHNGDLDIHSRIVIGGMVTGDVTVHDGGQLTVEGLISGTLHVLKGGTADVAGVLVGGYGTLEGKLTLRAGAFVRERMVGADGDWVPQRQSKVNAQSPRFLVKPDGSLQLE